MTSPPNNAPATYRRVVGAVLFLLVAGGGTAAYQHFTSVYHLAVVQPGVLYRDGARSINELKRALAKTAPKTVVCLVDDQELADPGKPQFKEEIAFLQQQGIRVERIPVRLGGWPASDDVQRFLNVTAKRENQPVLVHCAQGVRRTGMMAAAFQMSILGYDKERAKAEILTFGHSENTIGEIRTFIDAYDGKHRTVSQDLAQQK